MQAVSVITLGIDDIDRSKRFYRDGFGWRPVFENEEIAFYQMNGLVLGTWLKSALADDMRAENLPGCGQPGQGAFALAHNIGSIAEVDDAIAALVKAGGTLLRPGDAPPHGGYRGYVADPDGHAWEIAWNPAWPIDGQGNVTFAL